MRAHSLRLIFALPLLTAAGATPVLPQGPNANQQLANAQKEAADSARDLDRLTKAAAAATGEVAKAKAEQAAAAAAIAESEARIFEADAEARLAEAQAALGKARLDRQRAPMAALLGGLVSIGREPPILALFDGTSPQELVRLKSMVDTLEPVIRQRTAGLAAEYRSQQQLAGAAKTARARLADNRKLLTERQRKFAQLEQAASEQAATLTSQSLYAGDRVLADQEQLLGAQGTAQAQGRAMASARRLAELAMSPPRPVAGDASLPASDFAYIIPVSATVSDGVGSVNKAGIVARGTRFETRRGTPVMAPASGTILFSGPFRSYDGLVIIGHGGGKISLLLGVATTLPKGQKVEIGQQIGIATGPVDVEFRDNGRIMSPAFIAASSPPLSNAVRTR